jgi:ABC-type transporter Mla MlaB component
MTLRIEKDSNGQSTTIRLIGRMQREHLKELKSQIEAGGTRVTLDLNEVSLVDFDVIRFLATCQTEGIPLVHCSVTYTTGSPKRGEECRKGRRDVGHVQKEADHFRWIPVCGTAYAKLLTVGSYGGEVYLAQCSPLFSKCVSSVEFAKVQISR